MFDSRVIFLDLETTGASADRDRITEIGLVELENGAFVDEWTTLVNPQRPIPQSVAGLTGITDDAVANAPRFTELSAELLQRLDGRLLVAHNVRFDSAFLRAEFQRVGVRFRPRTLCTVRLSRLLFPEHPHHNLDSIIERFELPCAARHRALPDAQVLWSFARELSRRVDAQQLANAVGTLTQRPALPPGVDAERFEDLPVAPGVYVFYADDGSALFAGKSANLRSRVLAHFSAGSEQERNQAMALRTASLEWTETAGELGASLRLVALLRRLRPLYNRNRNVSEAWALNWQPPNRVCAVDTRDAADEPSADLYGIYRSRSDASSALRGLVRGHRLCPILIGLEAGPAPCSAHAAGACLGACVGNETASQHSMRLIAALARLRVPAWPFRGRVAVRESDNSRALSEVHLLDRWRYLGSARTDSDLDALIEQEQLPDFDVDHYRLIKRYLDQADGSPDIVDLTRHRDLVWPGAAAAD